MFAGRAGSVEAREAAGGGIFLDLSGCLGSSPCTNTVVLFPQLRLILGDGLLVAHLEILNLFPTSSALWMPFAVFQFPIRVSPTIEVTPYFGMGPILGSAHAPQGTFDWMLKFGDVFSIEGFGIYTEVLLSIPFSSIPSISFGSLVEF